jgi:hypothetical protein
MVKGMLLKALSRDDDRIAQVGRIARERAHAAGVPCYYIDESLDPKGRIIRHDPDGTRHSPTATRASSSIASYHRFYQRTEARGAARRIAA